MVLLIFSITSCAGHKYYRRVANNISSFDNAISDIRQQGYFTKTDTLLLSNGHIINYNNVCIYPEKIKDPSLNSLMQKYEFKRICFSKNKTQYFDSVITFHKDFSPWFGKAIVVTYDFGKSGLRKLTKKGVALKNEEVRVINDLYLYQIRSKPAFGE